MALDLSTILSETSAPWQPRGGNSERTKIKEKFKLTASFCTVEAKKTEIRNAGGWGHWHKFLDCILSPRPPLRHTPCSCQNSPCSHFVLDLWHSGLVVLRVAEYDICTINHTFYCLNWRIKKIKNKNQYKNTGGLGLAVSS